MMTDNYALIVVENDRLARNLSEQATVNGLVPIQMNDGAEAASLICDMGEASNLIEIILVDATMSPTMVAKMRQNYQGQVCVLGFGTWTVQNLVELKACVTNKAWPKNFKKVPSEPAAMMAPA